MDSRTRNNKSPVIALHLTCIDDATFDYDHDDHDDNNNDNNDVIVSWVTNTGTIRSCHYSCDCSEDLPSLSSPSWSSASSSTVEKQVRFFIVTDSLPCIRDASFSSSTFVSTLDEKRPLIRHSTVNQNQKNKNTIFTRMSNSSSSSSTSSSNDTVVIITFTSYVQNRYAVHSGQFIRIHSYHENSIVALLPLPMELKSVPFKTTMDHSMIVMGDFQGQVFVCQYGREDQHQCNDEQYQEEQKIWYNVKCHTRAVSSISITPSSRFLCTVGWDGKLTVLQLQSQQQKKNNNNNSKKEKTKLKILDKIQVTTSSAMRKLLTLSTVEKKESENHVIIAVGGDDSIVHLYKFSTQTLKLEPFVQFPISLTPITALAFTSTSLSYSYNALVSGCRDGTVRIHYINTKKTRLVYSGVTSRPPNVCPVCDVNWNVETHIPVVCGKCHSVFACMNCVSLMRGKHEPRSNEKIRRLCCGAVGLDDAVEDLDYIHENTTFSSSNIKNSRNPNVFDINNSDSQKNNINSMININRLSFSIYDEHSIITKNNLCTLYSGLLDGHPVCIRYPSPSSEHSRNHVYLCQMSRNPYIATHFGTTTYQPNPISTSTATTSASNNMSTLLSISEYPSGGTLLQNVQSLNSLNVPLNQTTFIQLTLQLLHAVRSFHMSGIILHHSLHLSSIALDRSLVDDWGAKSQTLKFLDLGNATDKIKQGNEFERAKKSDLYLLAKLISQIANLNPYHDEEGIQTMPQWVPTEIQNLVYGMAGNSDIDLVTACQIIEQFPSAPPLPSNLQDLASEQIQTEQQSYQHYHDHQNPEISVFDALGNIPTPPTEMPRDPSALYRQKGNVVASEEQDGETTIRRSLYPPVTPL